MSYRVRFGGFGWLTSPAPRPREAQAVGVTFSVYLEDEETRCLLVSFGVNAMVAFRLFPAKLGEAGARTVDEGRLGAALELYALPRVEAGLRDGSFAAQMERGEEVVEILSPEEAEGLATLLRRKECRYLLPGPDDQCGTGRNPANGQTVALPATPHLCGACARPDDRVVCSMLHHVRTWVITPGRIDVTGTMCGANKKESPNAAMCRPGRHECWHRLVEPQAREEVVHLSPLTLPEALGYLDAVWRDAVREGPLLAGNTLAGSLLAMPCRDAADFREKVKGLVDGAFDALRVPGGRPRAPAAARLAELREFLERWASSREGASDDLRSVKDAISVLEKVNTIRSNLEHSDPHSRGAFEEAKRALGIRLPAGSYREEWDRLVASVVEALRVVREFLRKHGQEAGPAPTAPPPQAPGTS